MLKQQLSQKLLQKLSPQQIQLMKLVQLPTLAFEQRIKEELELNPALEDNTDLDNNLEEEYSSDNEDNEYDENSIDNDLDTTEDINIEDYINEEDYQDYGYTDKYSHEEKEMPYAQGISFQTYLLNQLHTFKLTDEEYLKADFIIGNLDDDGYLRRELKSIVDDIAFTIGITTNEKELEYLLINYIQKLDPEGVGARTLQECLIIQLSNKEQNENIKLAKNILKNNFEAFAKKHYTKILLKENVAENQLKLAISEIEKLNPKPGISFTDENKNIEQITPDFIIKIINGQLNLTLNSSNTPELKVSPYYMEMLETFKDTEKKSKEQKEAIVFVKQKLDSAKWFIDAIKQRHDTLYTTMKAIMDYQEEYLLTGDDIKLKPMILRDISEKIGLDVSTVSRVANSKYVSTPYGTFLIKNLFSEGMSTDEGDEVSTLEIKSILQDVLNAEDKKQPLTDEKLTSILKDKGYNIARRTVAKYREQLNIPVARLRKEI